MHASVTVHVGCELSFRIALKAPQNTCGQTGVDIGHLTNWRLYELVDKLQECPDPKALT